MVRGAGEHAVENVSPKDRVALSLAKLLDVEAISKKRRSINMAEKKPKKVFEVKVKCPFCKKGIIVKKTKKTIHPAEPAEYEEKVTAEKDSQTTLKDPK